MWHSESKQPFIYQKSNSSFSIRRKPVSSTGFVEDISGWPMKPVQLRRSAATRLVSGALDFLTLLVPIPFLVLAGIAIVRDGKLVQEEDWERIQKAMNVAVSAFPILFAIVLGRLTRVIATWKLEKGSSLGSIEQLLWSSTVGSTIWMLCSMRSFNLMSLGLLVLWALSPLGGQASLHIIHTETHTLSSTTNLSYLNSRLWPPFSSSGDLGYILQPINSVYISSIVAPESLKLAPMDMWGNVKIPSLSRLNSPVNATGWKAVNSQSDATHTALVGIPINGPEADANTSFNLETSYFDIDCFDVSLQPTSFPLANLSTMSFTVNTDPPVYVKVPNNSYVGGDGSTLCEALGCTPSFSIGIDHYISNRWIGTDEGLPNVTGNTQTLFPQPPVFLFQSRYWGLPQNEHHWASVARCHLNRIFVEVAVTCIGQTAVSTPQCSVTAIRDSLKPHIPKDVTPFLFPMTMVNFATSLVSSSEASGHSAMSSLTERFMNNSANPLMADTSDNSLYELPKDVFSERLTQVINTYYLASLLPESMTGNLLTSETGSSEILNATGIQTVLQAPRYRVSWGWIVLFLLSTLTMLVGAVWSAILYHRITIPDILGYVSSMTRDVKHSSFPPGGTALDGLERSRLLRDVPVRLGDVRAHDDLSGYISFTMAHIAQRPERGRYYD